MLGIKIAILVLYIFIAAILVLYIFIAAIWVWVGLSNLEFQKWLDEVIEKL